MLKVDTDQRTLERFVSELDEMDVDFVVSYAVRDEGMDHVIHRIETFGRGGKSHTPLTFRNTNVLDHELEYVISLSNDSAARGSGSLV